MSCERIVPLLPLLALDAAEAPEADAAREHLLHCERCAASLRELVATRGALASFTVGDSPTTDPAEIRATWTHRGARSPGARPRLAARLLKAAAALLVVGVALGYAWTHGSVAVDRGTATLRIAWGARGATAGSDFRAREDALEPVAVATALAELERRVEELEVRHEQDLLLLARSVDLQQRSRDRGVAERLRTLEEATNDGFLFTNSVLDGVASRLATTAAVDQH